MFDRIKQSDGFTLIELLMALIILGILAQMAMTFALDLRKRAFDATALADGKNLMTVAGNSFLGLDDIDYNHTPADGSQVGVLDTSGAPREPVFTLSPGVKAVIFGDSPGIPGGGLVTARVYHINGTNDATGSGKREFWFMIDEMTSFISAPSL
ncbi:MAG: type II secretion system protein [Thermodesulfobacteriota bacterium]